MPSSQNSYAITITRPSVKTHNAITISRPSAFTPDKIFNFLTHLIAMNGHSVATEHKEKLNAEATPESSPDSAVPTDASKSSESSEPTSESQKSTSSSPEGDTDTDSTSSNYTQSTTSQTSTASNRTLRPRVPINYNETLLKCLHGTPQIRTLHNVSIPFPDSIGEETQETDEHTWEDPDEHTQKRHTWRYKHEHYKWMNYSQTP